MNILLTIYRNLIETTMLISLVSGLGTVIYFLISGLEGTDGHTVLRILSAVGAGVVAFMLSAGILVSAISVMSSVTACCPDNDTVST